MIASKDILHRTVRGAYSGGRDGFKPEMIDIDQAWITKTLGEYTDTGARNI